jgi:hypothetical protein
MDVFLSDAVAMCRLRTMIDPFREHRPTQRYHYAVTHLLTVKATVSQTHKIKHESQTDALLSRNRSVLQVAFGMTVYPERTSNSYTALPGSNQRPIPLMTD